MTLTSSPPARRASCQRSLRHLGISTTLLALVATVLALLPSTVSAATHNVDGRLTKSAKTATHQVTVERGTLEATLSFTLSPAPESGTPTAKVTLERTDGTVVGSSWGSSPVTLQRDLAAGTYQLTVSTGRSLTHRSLDYRLVVNSPDPGPAPDLDPVPAGPLADKACGTWVLYQVSSVGELDRLRPKIEAALRLPGVAGFSVRFPWDAADMTGTQTTTPLLGKAKEIASSQGKPLSVRFMAGAHTPTRVFDAGAAYYTDPSGRKVPLPWDNATGTNDVFLTAYDAYVGRLAAWSKANGVSLLHLSWYGQDWAELNHGKEVREAAGYTQDAWMQGHRELIRVGGKHASADLAVEMPLSGYGPLSGGQSATLADEIIAQVGQNSDRFFIQANGWDETREWGAPDMTVEGQFDRIWAEPVLRGLQMIQPDGYDWARVFDRLDLVGATYAEVYLPSFWQVPGPTPQYNHNTTERIAQLETEIEAFARRTC